MKKQKGKICNGANMKYEKSIFLSDIHIPFHNPDALGVVMKLMKDFKPDYVFLVGDIIDFYAISHFDKEPTRIISLQQDIDQTVEILRQLKKVSPHASWTFLEGNHEDRLRKFIWKNPELSGLSALTVPSLLNLKEIGIQYVPITKTYKYHNFIINHGDVSRKFSVYTAKAMLEKYGMSGISGHSHRLGTYYLSNESGDYIWAETGCLCDLQPDYINYRPNWLNGFSIGYFKKDNGRFIIEQIPIIDKMAVYAGKEYRA